MRSFDTASSKEKSISTVQTSCENSAAIQCKGYEAKTDYPQPVTQLKGNKSGLPNGLKSGIENLSGFSMDDVQVHYNSAKPAALNALAYAQGTDIHVGPGQEQHLAHEAWHVAQQKQGRVKPTMQLKGKVAINDNEGLEQEAEVMGKKATGVRADVAQLKTNGGDSARNGKTIQLFTKIKKKNYKLKKDTAVDARAPFTRFDEDLSMVDDGAAMGMEWSKHLDDLPPLNVANDKTIAINANEGEPKEFYATAAVLKKANSELQGVKSPVSLVHSGNKITIPGKKRKELNMVQPVVEKMATPGKDEFTKMVNSICRDVAGEIIGGINHAVIKSGDTKKATPISAIDSTVVDGTHNLADAVSKRTLTTDDAIAAIGDKKKDLKPGKEYGKATRKRGKAKKTEEDLGLNASAKASIGQAYLTQSIFDTTGSKVDYADSAEPTNAFVWGYHFGAVVAESVDKSDQIIMENYNRATDVKDGKKKLLQELKDKFTVQLTALVLKPEESDDVQIGRITEFLNGKGAILAKDAKDSYDAMFKRLNDTLTTHWYFRIAGEGKGQSWHEQMGGSGFFVNPLTMAVANLQKATDFISFDEGSSGLSVVSTRNVKSIAVKILSAIQQKLQPKEIQITGYANGWKGTGIGSEKTGNKRADAVINELLAAKVPANLIKKVNSPGKDVQSRRGVEIKMVY